MPDPTWRPLRRPRWTFSLRRHPTPYWLAVGAVAGATALLIATVVGRADAERRRWGETRTVVVAAAAVEPGTTLEGGHLVLVEWPSGLVPDGALGDRPVGQVVTAALAAGEPVLAHHLRAGGSGLSSRLPAGSRALSVPAGPAPLALAPGDQVDVLATVDPSVSGGADPTFAVAEAALVVAVADEAVTVAVTVGDAARVAFAVAHGIVTLALVPA